MPKKQYVPEPRPAAADFDDTARAAEVSEESYYNRRNSAGGPCCSGDAGENVLTMNRDTDFSDINFWMLNDRLEEDELLRQLRGMKDKGITSFIARTYIGLESDYPGPEFKRKLLFIVRSAEKLGMKLFLQAGYMPDAVPELAEELKAEYLDWEDGRVVVKKSGDGLDVMNASSVACYLKSSYEEMWRDFRPYFGSVVTSIWVDEPAYPRYKTPWSRMLPEAFRRFWGYDPDGRFDALFRDVPGAETFRYHYRETVVRLMEEAYFAPMRAWCARNGLLCSGHLLAEDSLAGTIGCGGAMMPFYRYFDIPGIDILAADTRFARSPLERKFPGPEPRAALYVTPIQCVSAANQAGGKHILCEMYGVSSENFGPREQKNMFDHFAALGITRRSVHGIFYSLRGRRKRAYPPHVGYCQPYWEHYAELTRECRETAQFISRGEPVRDTLVIHPLGSAEAEFNYSRGFSSLARRDLGFLTTLVELVHGHSRFDLGDEITIASQGEAADGIFSVGSMRYRSVLLPDLLVIAGKTLRLLKDFLASGGTVWIYGQTPRLKDGIPAESEITEALAGAVKIDTLNPVTELPRNYQLEVAHGEDLIVNQRHDGEAELFFIANCDFQASREIALSLPGKRIFAQRNWQLTELPGGRAVIPEGGSIRLLALPGEKVKSTPTPCGAAASKGETLIRELDSDWKILRRSQPNSLLLEFARYRKNSKSDWSPLYPILAIDEILVEENYRGPLELCYAIDSSLPVSGARLALETPEDQRIFCNGEPVSNHPDGFFSVREFQTVPLPPLKQGVNFIELKREYAPLRKFKNALTSLFEKLDGVELECVYLLGDFSLQTKSEYTRTNCLRLQNHFRLTAESGKTDGALTENGYPFFAGSVTLEQEFNWNGSLRNPKLNLETPDASVVTAVLNGTELGARMWFPYTWEEIPLRPGKNTLRLELFGTLRNLLGPWHRPRGEYGECFGGYNNPNLNWVGAYDQEGNRIEKWYDRRNPDLANWCEGYQLVRFGIGGKIRIQADGESLVNPERLPRKGDGN